MPFLLASAFALVFLLPLCAPSHAAETVALFLKGQKQGEIKGESAQRSPARTDSIECLYYEQGAVSPRDAASGLPTGKRTYRQVVFRKRIDRSSPLLWQAMATNENLPEATFKFFRPTTSGLGLGVQEQFYTVKLTNASIASIRDYVPSTVDPTTASQPPMEEVTLTFQKIEWTFTTGGITSMDTWSATP
jgi:type VI secretion system secreted protein Hcp